MNIFRNFSSHIDLHLDPDYVNQESTSSSPIFYEKPGIPEMNDDNDEKDVLTLSPNGTRRVKFSTAPIRVSYLIRKIFEMKFLLNF